MRLAQRNADEIQFDRGKLRYCSGKSKIFPVHTAITMNNAYFYCVQLLKKSTLLVIKDRIAYIMCK